MVNKFFLSQIYQMTLTKNRWTVCSTCSLSGEFSQSSHYAIYLIKELSRRAARQLPCVVRVPNPFETEEPAIAVSHNSSNDSDGPSPLPSEEWRETFEYRFLNFRKV